MATPARDRRLRSLYDISSEDYDAVLTAQGGGCAVCGREPDAGRHLDVDHDHVTLRLRGLLCRRCNTWLIGKHRDPALFAGAAQYLTSPPADAILAADHRVPKRGTRKRKV